MRNKLQPHDLWGCAKNYDFPTFLEGLDRSCG